MSMYRARDELHRRLQADAGWPVEYDAHDDDGVIAVYASTYGNTVLVTFTLPPAWVFDRDEVEEFFARGRQLIDDDARNNKSSEKG